MIQKVSWDSKFFGYSVGAIEYNGNNYDSLSLKNLKSLGYNLIYIYSKTELPANFKFNLVDKKITYHKELSVIEGKYDLVEFDENKHSYNQLLELAYLSGKYSRFNHDKNFINNEFNRMYKTWLDKSLNKEIAFKVLISLEDGIITGFVTLKEKNNICSQIGLIAVNNKFQGKRIGTKLIKECEILSLKCGYKELEVVTQYGNEAARGLYEKNGFKVSKELFIYHHWNNESSNIK